MTGPTPEQPEAAPVGMDREKLIDVLFETEFIACHDWVGTGSGYPPADQMRREVGEVADAAIAALAVPAQVDEAKLSGAIAGALDGAGIQSAMGEAWRVDSHEVVSIREAVVEQLRGGGR